MLRSGPMPTAGTKSKTGIFQECIAVSQISSLRFVREHLRRRARKPPLPSMILSNVRSLAPKMDELHAITKTCFEYCESNLMVFTESWLHEGIPDWLLELDGYMLVRADCSIESGKKSRGGVCMYICDKWCKQYTVRDKVCTPDIELLCVSLRSHYLQREFGCFIICAVYIPPSGNTGKAATCIAECAHEQLQSSPRAPIFFLGDFNHCKLETVLAGFEQYVRCDTRKTKILDKCYGSVKNAYVDKPKAPLSNSDHNVLHLIPSYESVFKTYKPEYKTVNIWTEDSMETLKGCFLCTDWSIFHQLELDEATDTISDYINFCVDNVVEKKDVVVYPNNKPYFTKDIKECIINKKLAFRNRDKVGPLVAQKELKYNLKKSKGTAQASYVTQFLYF